MEPFYKNQWWLPTKFHPKARPRAFKNKVVSGTKENRKNEETIRLAFLNSHARTVGSSTVGVRDLPSWLPHPGHISCRLVFCYKPADPKKHPYLSRYKGLCDGDNLEKAVWDALNGVLWDDDSWISKWSGEKIWWKHEGIFMRVAFYQ